MENTSFIPALVWLKAYRRENLLNDTLAAVVVTIMLVPQSLAYALLAGLPAEMGLYSCILPLIAYALFGTSQTLSVGPVAVSSLMTASAVGAVATKGTADYATAATTLALLGGFFLIIMGFLKFGFVANFLSHPVMSGFITAAAIIIALSQLGSLLGLSIRGDSLPALVDSLIRERKEANKLTALVGVGGIFFLLFARYGLGRQLRRAGLSRTQADIWVRCAPILLIFFVIPLSIFYSYESKGVPLVGHVPRGIPAFSLPNISFELIQQLALPAMLIAFVGFVESVSIGKTLGAKKHQRIYPNQELIGLGVANTAAAISNGFPVTGGFSRSVVNFDAGANTQMASLITALGIALTALLLTPVLYFLPKSVLAAIIITAVLNLVDFRTFIQAKTFSAPDFATLLTTILTTLMAGVELGILIGVTLSISIHLYRTSQPHFAIVGQVAGSEHYRNIDRYEVITHAHILAVRIDESLYFANTSYLEEIIFAQIARYPALEHVILMSPAVNGIDLSALETLRIVNTYLSELGVKMHLSEVKGPVMDALARSDFLEHLTGQVFLSHHSAITALTRRGS